MIHEDKVTKRIWTRKRSSPHCLQHTQPFQSAYHRWFRFYRAIEKPVDVPTEWYWLPILFV